jgi:hypothetical protein
MIVITLSNVEGEVMNGISILVLARAPSKINPRLIFITSEMHLRMINF